MPGYGPGWEEENRKALVQGVCSLGHARASVSVQWALEYWGWLFDECKFDINMVTMTWLWSPTATNQEVRDNPDAFRHQLRVLDFGCITCDMLAAEELLEFCLKRGATSCHSLDWLLMFLVWKYQSGQRAHVRRMAERLIKAGAGLTWLEDGRHPAYVQYLGRQHCRVAAVIVLRMDTLRPDLKVRVPRDVWRMVAERVWAYSQCFYGKE